MNTITVTELACGMPLIVEHTAAARSLGLTWLLPAGSARDPRDRLGRSAMTSELLLRGAGDRDSRQQADAFDRIGASRSADNGARMMNVSATLLASRLPDALPLIVDMVRSPRMSEQSIEPVRDLCLQAIESLADEPQQRALYAARARHFPEPLDRTGLGTPEGINALTRDELLEGWHALARPVGSVLGVCGPVDAAEIADRLNALLDGWTGSTPDVDLGPRPERGYGHETDDSNQVQIILVHDAPPDGHEDAPLEKVLTAVLSGGMSGRLFTEVREKRALCYSVSASYRPEKAFGSVTAYVGTSPDRAQESLDVLRGELERVMQTGVDREEFDRAVVGLKSRIVFSGESTSARAAAIASDYHRIGRPRSLEEKAGEIDAVTLDRLNDYLKRRTLGRMTIQTLGPKPLAAPAD